MRYKTIVIPKHKDKYVVVKDRKYQEITFIGGGCKIYETSKNCAFREFIEETVKSINLPDLPSKPTFSFQSRERSAAELKKDIIENVVVTLHYDVYIVNIPTLNFNEIKKQYHKVVSFNSETDDIYLKSKDDLKRSTLWRFMKDNVLNKLK
jgi:hypothetical protein